MSSLQYEKTDKQCPPIPKPRASQRRGKCISLFQFIRNFNPVWLGAYSKETLPTFAHSLRKTITFIDTAVDCIEHISSPLISQQSTIVIISDEYATDRKVIAHLLNLTNIQTICIVSDDLQSGSIDSFFNDRRIQPILNSTLAVLVDLAHDQSSLDQFDVQLDNFREATRKCNENVDQIDIVDYNQESVRSKQIPSPSSITERNIRFEQTPLPSSPTERNVTSEHIQAPYSKTQRKNEHEGTVNSGKVEESVEYYKGFVTMGYQHFPRSVSSNDRQAPFGEVTATAERFRDRAPVKPDNDWCYGRGPFVYHWHPSGPSFRNVRRLR